MSAVEWVELGIGLALALFAYFSCYALWQEQVRKHPEDWPYDR